VKPLLARLRGLSGWPLVWAVALVLCVFVLLANVVVSEVDPASSFGLAYGIAAAVLLGVACAYPVRRRLPRRGPLTAHTSLRLHEFVGAFFVLLVLMHSAFRPPTGTLGWSLWSLSLWTGLSGAIGLVIQWWIPRSLSSGLTTEVHYDRIPMLVADMARRADALVERSSDTVRRYYRDTLSALMGAPQARLIYFVDVTGGIQARIRDFDYLDRFADADEAQRIAELRELFRAKLEADAHFTLQRALRWWIYGHVPTVGLLVVLVVIHIMSIVYF
jgi:hypothetical protein